MKTTAVVPITDLSTLLSPTSVDDVLYNSTIASTLSTFYPIIVTEMLLSVSCLVVTCYAYSSMRQFQNLPGRNVLTLATCLLVSYVFLTLDLLLRDWIPFDACVVIATAVHFAFLATFFWTNVLAFDIMSCTLETVLISDPRREVAQYRRYAAYAWIATTLVALPAVVLDRVDLLPPGYRPQFGKSRCWLSGTYAFVLYFNGPVGAILLANTVIFIRTSFTISRIKNMAASLQVHQNRKRFRLYVKLVFVMGLLWLTEFIPWITGVYQLYIVAGMLNSLHGVFLFIIFICKRKVLVKMKKEWCFGKFKWRDSNTPACRHTSPSVTTITSTVSNPSETTGLNR